MRYLNALFMLIFSCAQVDQEKVLDSYYPKVDTLIKSQFDRGYPVSLSKIVSLDGKSEQQNLSLDSAGWAKELVFLSEINPNHPAYIGTFSENKMDNFLSLKLNPDEKGALTLFSLETGKNIQTINATIHENKEVYIHHKDIKVTFREGVITSYEIDGYQKIVLKDSIFFTIKAMIN